jgi:hypothetical protein
VEAQKAAMDAMPEGPEKAEAQEKLAKMEAEAEEETELNLNPNPN